ncbi:sh3-binding [Anaeramoeba ignava]|uniref:Sh3-binding n=1 Tax=Anaeramoeba ignava TaxID=1746090 RepID=A0A9Q0LA32_ANAIG|nr:sh3-binding [Anaeramoeba ignava]KAJ5070036.1 sh3-binding [Anaeramoeba ignava]
MNDLKDLKDFYSGYLLQKSIFHRWNKKYIKITNERKIYIFKEKNDKKAKHEYQLSSYEVKETPISKFKKANVFYISMKDLKRKKKKIYFCCNDQRERNNWIESIHYLFNQQKNDIKQALTNQSLQNLSPTSIQPEYL